MRRHEEVSELLDDLRNPNPGFLNQGKRPLAERNPLVFWKALSGLLALIVLVLLFRSR